MPTSGYARNVFLNVPFDARYRSVLEALVFVIHDCGFWARCALESDDSSVVRLEKIVSIIRGCRYGIHDLSRVTLDTTNRLPRFNMPLELGIFLGAKRFGSGKQRTKCCLILEHDQYRYQKYCSDIAGQDIRAHAGAADAAIRAVRNWLQAAAHPRHLALPGADRVVERYTAFRNDLPTMAKTFELTMGKLTFLDYRMMVDAWLAWLS